MAIQRVKLNRAGMKALLTSNGVREDLEHRMAAVKARTPNNPTTETDTSHERGGWARARVRVEVTGWQALGHELKHGEMAAALDEAGRIASRRR